MKKDEAQPLLSHIDELIRRIKRSLIYFLITFGVGYFYTERALLLVMVPIKKYLPDGAKLVYTQPFEQVFVIMKTAAIIGALIALPALFLEFFAFVNKGLTKSESKKVWVTAIGTWFLAAAGVIWSYYFLLPTILEIVLSYQNLDLSPVISLSYYVNASLGLLLVGAVFFEIPFLMILSSAWGWVDSRSWAKFRKFHIVIAALLSAVLSPPDLLSMFAVMLPLLLLYEVGAQGAKLFSK